MWYKTALTVIDPTGQINFPDMGGHKFNLNDLKFYVRDKDYKSTRSVTIFAYIPAKKNPIGQLAFTFDRGTNAIEVEGTLVEKIGRISLDKLQQQQNDQVQLKTTGIGIGKKLYEKFLEIVQNDEEMSKADFVRGSVHSQQAYKAKNNAFGKPFEAKSKFKIPENRQAIQDEIIDLEFELEDPDITFDRKRQILQLINSLKYELEKSVPVSHEEAMDILVPASWSKGGSYSDRLSDFPNVETKHRIPPKSEEKPKRKPVQNPNQLNLDVTASNKNYKIALTKMDPAGQMRMDMPKTKFNLEENTRYTVWTNKYELDPTIPVVIRLYEKNNNQELGDVMFTYYPAYYDSPQGKLPYPIISIYRIKIDELGLEEYMEINEQAGEDVESQRSGWGLGQYLYKLMKNYISEHFPDAKFITGEVHSSEAFKSRNKVFGKPHTLQWNERDEDGRWKKDRITEEKAMKKLPPAKWDSWGSARIDQDQHVRVVHKLPEQKQQKSQEEDESQLKMDI